MKKIKIKCNYCGITFEKQLKEYNRQLKNKPDYKFYCSRKCTGKAVGIRNFINSDGTMKYPSNKKNLLIGSNKDEYSPFRIHMKSVRNRIDKDNNIDEKYLKKI
jgi:hypothetical protein